MVLLLLFICRLLMAISVVNIVFFVLLLFAGEKFAGSVDRRMLAKDISEIVKKMWRVGGTALRVYVTSRIQVLMKSLWRRWRIFRFGPLPRANSTLYTQSGKVRWSNQNQQKSVECFWHEWVDIYTAFEWARKFARKIKIRFVFASAHDWLSLFWSNQWLKYIAT